MLKRRRSARAPANEVNYDVRLPLGEILVQNQIVELNHSEIEEISGGLNARYILVGTLAGIVGGGLTVAGLGTPISIGGAALVAEGATLVGLGLAS
jgi:hypothetical protein